MIPYYSLTPSQITLFERPNSCRFSERQMSTFDNLKNNENKYYELSTHSRKRLKRSIDFLLYTSKKKSTLGSKFISKEINTEIDKQTGTLHKNKINFKLTFITLTLSATQHNTDEEIKSKLLNNFLTSARRKWNMKDYIWKAEKQENGNIHFHILSNNYIKHQELRAEWNKIQNKPGFNYVNLHSQNMQEYFKDGFRIFINSKRTIEQQLEAYNTNKAINWTNPNSTDIHSLYKIKNISAYMSKYLAKAVTKTDRVKQLEKLYSDLQIQQDTFKSNEVRELFNPDYDNIQAEIEINIKNIESQIQELKNKGVSGKIWAQSQSLSHFTNYIDCQHWQNIPDINYIMSNYEYMNEIELGSSKIITYKFDIEKTKALKEILDEHIKKQII